MKPHRPLALVLLAVFGLLLPAWAQGPPALTKKQANKQLQVAVKEMTKQQTQQQQAALLSFKTCTASLQDTLAAGLPPELALESLRDCLTTFVDRLALAEYECRDGLMQQTSQLLGQVDTPPPGFMRGDGGAYDKALTTFRARTEKRLRAGLHVLDKTFTKTFSVLDYSISVRAVVPDLDNAIPTSDGVRGDLRPAPVVAVLVAGSSTTETNDGMLFASGYSYDPDVGLGIEVDGVPMLDAVQLEGRTGMATVLDVPLSADPDEPVSVTNPPMRWKVGFYQYDEPGIILGLPEGNVIVRAIQNGVIGSATINVP